MLRAWGELKMHTKFENLMRGELLGDLVINFEDDREMSFQTGVVML
jgi:hypothetical protein